MSSRVVFRYLAFLLLVLFAIGSISVSCQAGSSGAVPKRQTKVNKQPESTDSKELDLRSQRTQVNEQTDLFKKKFEGAGISWEEYKGDIATGMKGSVELIKGSKGTGLPLQMKKDQTAAELDQEVKSLKSIEEKELNNRGMAEMQKQDTIRNLYRDYAEGGNKMHWKYAKELAEGQDNLAKILMGKLKELGVDCRTVEGDKEQEPTFYLQIEQKKHKDTKYNQAFCEALRNSYNCTDSLQLRCLEKGMKWGPWQHKKIRFAGDKIYHEAKAWGYAIYWKKKRWGWIITPNHPKSFWGGYQVDSGLTPAQIASQARTYIANHLGVNVEQIGENIAFPGRGIGGTHPVYERWRIVFNEYEFGYDYREGDEICKQWEETWTQRCYQR